MSRAAFIVALSRAMGRTPTDAELTEFLCQLRDMVGDRVYVPQRSPTDPAVVAKILARRKEQWSIRRIAKESGLSKSQVHVVLSQNPSLFLDKEAA